MRFNTIETSKTNISKSFRSSKSVLLEVQSKTDSSDSGDSRPSTPTGPISSSGSPSSDNETMRSPVIKRKLGRRLSYLIQDLREVSSSSLDSSSESNTNAASSSFLNKKRAEILLKKQPINGWGFSRWCYASIAIGRVSGLTGFTPLILYGSESLTSSSKMKFSPSRLITSCSKKKNRRSSSLQVVKTSEARESMIQEAKGSPTPMIGTMRPVSPTPSLKLMDDTPALEMTSISSSPSKEDEDVSSKEQEVSSFLTPKRRGLSPTSPTQQLQQEEFSTWCSSAKRENFFSYYHSLILLEIHARNSQSKCTLEYTLEYYENLTRASRSNTGTEAHRKYAILVSTEDEIHAMLRRIRSADMRHLFVSVLNISNQRRRINLSFRKYDDALCFFESALEAIVEANIRNLCDAVTMNRKNVVRLYTDTRSAESRMLAINITRKDRRSHTALDYAIHYKDEAMVAMLEEAAVLSCTSVAALAALRAAKYAKANADFAASLAAGDKVNSSSDVGTYLSEMTWIDDDGTVRTEQKMNRTCFWF